MPRTWAVAVLLALLPMAAGCATAHRPSSAARSTLSGPAALTAAGRGGKQALAAAYLAIAQPANRRLDAEVGAFTDHQHQDLAAAGAALRAEAATEGRFDRLLARIPFPPSLASTARAVIQANQRRVMLTAQQAASTSLTGLASLTARHRAADAAVEAQVRILRRALHLPPPANS
jgi:hypothetical protein